MRMFQLGRFASGKHQRLALKLALAALIDEDNAKLKTDTRPFGIKTIGKLSSGASDHDERCFTSVPQSLNDCQTAQTSKSRKKRDWFCGMCSFIRVSLHSDTKCSQPKKTESCYDCFECNKSFGQQNELTNHICKVHQ